MKVYVTLTAVEPQELKRKVDRYLSEYHPAGYGTKVTKQGISENGDYFADIRRYDSCD